MKKQIVRKKISGVHKKALDRLARFCPVEIKEKVYDYKKHKRYSYQLVYQDVYFYSHLGLDESYKLNFIITLGKNFDDLKDEDLEAVINGIMNKAIFRSAIPRKQEDTESHLRFYLRISFKKEQNGTRMVVYTLNPEYLKNIPKDKKLTDSFLDSLADCVFIPWLLKAKSLRGSLNDFLKESSKVG